LGQSRTARLRLDLDEGNKGFSGFQVAPFLNPGETDIGAVRENFHDGSAPNFDFGFHG
jgi:hypothetical protein